MMNQVRGLQRWRWVGALMVAPLATTACSGPPALAGLWSVGEAACAENRGLTFDAGVVTAHLGDQRMPLLDAARYEVSKDAHGLKVRIRHSLPEAPGGVSAAPGMGEIVLRQGADGWLRPVAQRFSDQTTGSVRIPVHNVGFAAAFTVRPCAMSWVAADRAGFSASGKAERRT